MTGIVGTCWSCDRPLAEPTRLQFGIRHSQRTRQRQIVLDPGTKLYEHHVRDQGDHDFGRPIGEMVAHPKKPGRYGLRNNGPYTWTTVRNGGSVSIAPKGVVRLRRGMNFLIENVQFEMVGRS